MMMANDARTIIVSANSLPKDKRKFKVEIFNQIITSIDHWHHFKDKINRNQYSWTRNLIIIDKKTQMH